MTTSDNRSNNNAPFWKPWGVWGFLWRTLLFLASIVLICYLLTLRSCDGQKERQVPGPVSPPGWDTISYPKNPYDTSYYLHPGNPNDTAGFGRPVRPLPPDIRDGQPVEGWGDSIPGVPELPAPRDNRIPPVNPYDSTRVVPNPLDSLSRIVCDQLIVLFNSTDLKADMASFARQFKQHYPSNAYQILYYNPNAGTMVLGVPEQELIKVMDELPKVIKGIDFKVTLNEIMQETYTPSDPGFRVFSYDEYFKLIQAYAAWDVTKGSSEVKVAIVDSYFDLTNPEIGERYVDPIHIPSKTKNVLPPLTPPRSPEELGLYCHGSHVAGLAIGGQNNRMGCSGIAPECSWIPVALGDQLTSFNVIEGILYAVYRGADVVNVSLGRQFQGQIPLDDQVEYAQKENKRGEELLDYLYKVANDHKCVIVTAAGNEDLLMGMDPMKRSKNIVKVEAVDGKGIKADFSNFGIVEQAHLNYSTVAAPGVKLWSATPRACVPYWKALEPLTGMKSSLEGLQEMDGTSMASPVVAGAVALLKSKNKELTTEEVIAILRMTSKQTDTIHPIGPTIQIKDALDATGGEKANFDDLMKDHNLLIGKWKSTYTISIVVERTGEKIDEAWCYMIFNSTKSGTIEWHSIERKIVQTAPLTVSWKSNSIEIYQHGNAKSPDGEELNKDDYKCHPNSDRLLEATAVRNGRERYKFMLEKVY